MRFCSRSVYGTVAVSPASMELCEMSALTVTRRGVAVRWLPRLVLLVWSVRLLATGAAGRSFVWRVTVVAWSVMTGPLCRLGRTLWRHGKREYGRHASALKGRWCLLADVYQPGWMGLGVAAGSSAEGRETSSNVRNAGVGPF